MILHAGTEDRGKRLDQFLREQLPDHSRVRLQGWIKQERVLVNGRLGKASQSLRGGETVNVEPLERPPLRAFAEDLPLEILYTDSDVVVVNKPAGMVVHAGAGNHAGTLVNALLHHLGELADSGDDLRPGIVHRLDRFTSGVLVVARTGAAHRALQLQFAGREVEKIYLALVHGKVTREQGKIDKPVTRDPRRRTRMTARLATGRSALTSYRVLERFEGFTLLEVRIGTGRTHQIRVHLASLGHPVAGDRLYGAPGKVEGRPPLGRYFLHAHRLGFRSPSSGQPINVEAPLPEELRLWMNDLRAASGAEPIIKQ